MAEDRRPSKKRTGLSVGNGDSCLFPFCVQFLAIGTKGLISCARTPIVGRNFAPRSTPRIVVVAIFFDRMEWGHLWHNKNSFSNDCGGIIPRSRLGFLVFLLLPLPLSKKNRRSNSGFVPSLQRLDASDYHFGIVPLPTAVHPC